MTPTDELLAADLAVLADTIGDERAFAGRAFVADALQRIHDRLASPRAVEGVERVIDACSAYIWEQYGIGALHHPVDRARITAALSCLSTPSPEQEKKKGLRDVAKRLADQAYHCVAGYSIDRVDIKEAMRELCLAADAVHAALAAASPIPAPEKETGE